MGSEIRHTMLLTDGVSMEYWRSALDGAWYCILVFDTPTGGYDMSKVQGPFADEGAVIDGAFDLLDALNDTGSDDD